MYGWRARLGFIVSSVNWVMEAEAFRMAPEGVSVHFTRMLLERVTVDDYVKWTERVEDAAKLLSTAEVGAIGLANSMGSFIKGPGGDLEIIRRMEQASGAACTTASTAIVEALKKFGAKVIAVAAPYEDPGINAKLKEFMEGNGIELKTIKNLPNPGPKLYRQVGNLQPIEAYRLAREIDSPGVDALVVTVCNFRTIDIIDTLEKDVGKPFITGSQATMWAALRKAGVKSPVKGFGRLLEET